MRLVRAREAAGLSRAQVAAQTKIPERHLAAMEQGNFAALPARTYAVGFSRSYAKAVGADEAEIVAAVREELAGQGTEPAHRGVPVFEPGDPARVPGAGLTWLALLLALGVVVAGLFFGWKTYFAPGGTLPSLIAQETPAPLATPSPGQPPAPAPALAGPVVFTATAPGIWVKFYDGAGQQLLQKELSQGESWTVPAALPQVMLWTARPEALSITIGGQPVAPLSQVQQMMKDVPVTAAALLARGAAAPPAPSAARTVSAPAATRSPPRPRPSAARTEAAGVPAPASEAAPAEAVTLPSPAANQPADR
jgi:hypothetical protein